MPATTAARKTRTLPTTGSRRARSPPERRCCNTATPRFGARGPDSPVPTLPPPHASSSVDQREGARVGQQCVLGAGVYMGAGVVVGDRCKIQNDALLHDAAELATASWAPSADSAV